MPILSEKLSVYMYFTAGRHPVGMRRITSHDSMKYGLFLFWATAVTAASGQSKRLDSQSDTAFWCELKAQDAARIGLADLTTSTDSLHFRYWMENQAVEVWTYDFVHFDGIISNHTEKVETNTKTDAPAQKRKFYSNKTKLSATEARNVFDLFDRAHMFQIPTDKQVKGWEGGLDGEEFILEYATGSTYSFRTWWTPTFQHGVPEADTLVAVNQQLRRIINLGTNWNSFLATLPHGCYTYGEMTTVCPITKAHRKKS
jgi:hypothetical protein